MVEGPLLHGDHVTLRPADLGFSEEELRRRYAWSKDDDLQYWSGSIPSATSFTDFKRVLPERDWPQDGRRHSFAMLHPRHGLVGMISCYGIDWRRRRGELGIYIGERTLWSRGLGTDAIITLLRHLFFDLDFTQVYLNTYDTNMRARRSYEKVGFVPIERRKRIGTHVGPYTELRMSIDAERFRALHGRDMPDSTQRLVAAGSREGWPGE